jgi:hypothetical protein
MKLHFKPIHFCFFWLTINLVQAAFTELTSDEGYYWFYSTSLQWGYYDHPPLLALLVKLGYSVFPNEFGVRLFTVLLVFLGMLLFFKLLPADEQKQKIAYLIFLSIPLFNYLSFIIFPDGPLLFFAAIYLYSYKRFIEKEDWAATLLMAISVALMLYSKYHGILVITLTVIAHVSLLRSKKFYIAMLLAFILFLPHLWWQYSHQFITFKYHLHGRASALTISHTFEYLSQQILAIGPALVIPFMIRTKDRFVKTLKYIAAGTFIFFLISSLRGFVHFHWTSIALYPLIYCTVIYFSQRRKKIFYAFCLLFALITICARLQLMFNILPVNNVGVDYYHNRKLWAYDIKQLAQNKPVFFGSNFRESSLYTFYTGSTGVSLQSGETRRSQYELWHYEDSLQGKDVLFVQPHPFKGSASLQTRMGKKIHYLVIPDFRSFYNTPVHLTIKKSLNKNIFQIQTTIKNIRSSDMNFNENITGNKPFLFFEVRKDKEVIITDTLHTITGKECIPAGKTKMFTTELQVNNLPKGTYILVSILSNYPLQHAYNSGYYTFKVE